MFKNANHKRTQISINIQCREGCDEHRQHNVQNSKHNYENDKHPKQIVAQCVAFSLYLVLMFARSLSVSLFPNVCGVIVFHSNQKRYLAVPYMEKTTHTLREHIIHFTKIIGVFVSIKRFIIDWNQSWTLIHSLIHWLDGGKMSNVNTFVQPKRYSKCFVTFIQ